MTRRSCQARGPEDGRWSCGRQAPLPPSCPTTWRVRRWRCSVRPRGVGQRDRGTIVGRLMVRDPRLMQVRFHLSMGVELLTTETLARLAGAGLCHVTRPALLAVIDHVRLRDVSYSSLIAAANVVQLGVIEALLDASAYIGLEDGGRSLLRSITNAPEPVFDEFMRDRRLLHGCGPASHGLGESAGRRSGRAERPSLPGSLRAIDGSPVRAGAFGAQRSN